MVPLYQVKAEFFRMLGHPVRIRVLELLDALRGEDDSAADDLTSSTAAGGPGMARAAV
jgi:hypothetical protein